MYQKRNKELALLSLYLSDYSKSLYLREISRLSGIPLRTVQTALRKLEKEKILKSSLQGKNKYFFLNLENVQTKNYLLQAEVSRTNLFIERYPYFKSFLKELKDSALVIVFGSFARFTAGKDSDLDLLIVAKQKAKLPLHLLPYKVHRVNLAEKDFLKAIKIEERFIKEVLDCHIILNNHSFFINALWSKYGK